MKSVACRTTSPTGVDPRRDIDAIIHPGERLWPDIVLDESLPRELKVGKVSGELQPCSSRSLGNQGQFPLDTPVTLGTVAGCQLPVDDQLRKHVLEIVVYEL